jgi:cytoskeletal protein RodZ
MARDRYEDEDEDDRPRRRRHDEDDEDDDRPRRRRRSREPEHKSNTGLIIGIVAGVILLIVVGCGVAGYFAFKKVGDKIEQEMAADEASGAAQEFFDELSSQRTKQAYDSTTLLFKTTLSASAFEDLLKKQPLLTQHNLATEQGYGVKPVGQSPNRTFTTTYILSDQVDVDEDLDDDGLAPKKLKPKKPATIAKTLAVQVILKEGPEGVWKVDTLSVAP